MAFVVRIVSYHPVPLSGYHSPTLTQCRAIQAFLCWSQPISSWFDEQGAAIAVVIRPRSAYILPTTSNRVWGLVMPLKFGTPEHWRKRAEEARNMAQQIEDPAAKREMLEISANYEKIAALAELKLIAEQRSKDRATED